MSAMKAGEIWDHRCDWPRCGAFGSYGYGTLNKPDAMIWRCLAHKPASAQPVAPSPRPARDLFSVAR